MITGTGVHDPPDSMFMIDWIGRSQSNGIGVHDPPEYATGCGKIMVQPEFATDKGERVAKGR
jgi:hypothetical protein